MMIQEKAQWHVWRCAVLLVAAFLGHTQVAGACSCGSGKVDSAKVRQSVEWLLANRANVVTIRVLRRVPEKNSSFEFAVIESWKGSYKPGDPIVASSIELTDCHQQVVVGEDLLVGFDDLTKANFSNNACPERTKERRIELEQKYLKQLSPKYR